MSTSASFRAFIPALTFFFAIVVRVGESAPRGASSSSRIRARRAMVPLAMARSTTSIRNDRRRVDRFLYRSTTRRFIFRRRERRSTDRPTDDSIQFDRRSSTRRRDVVLSEMTSPRANDASSRNGVDASERGAKGSPDRRGRFRRGRRRSRRSSSTTSPST